jgi:hypothetical protein
MKKFHHILSFLAIAFLASIFISGCTSNSPTTPPTTSNNVYPKDSSSYTYAKHNTDASGNQTGLDTAKYANVIATGGSFKNQSNVYTVVDDGDTAYYTYSSSNDVLAYIENSGAPALLQSAADTLFRRWITLAIATHSTGVIILDTMNVNVLFGGASIPAKAHMTSDYIGSDSVKLTSETLFVQHCRITITATSNYPLVSPPVTATYTRDLYFAPKIGYYAKETTKMVIPPIVLLGYAGTTQGTVSTLTTYTLK